MEAAVRWSPHSTALRQRFLTIDVADPTLTLNQVDRIQGRQIQYHAVAKYTKLPHFGACAWSPADESLVALGLASGSASLVKLRELPGQVSEIVATFKIKQQRKCNSVAISNQQWLAVALDKTRSDVCLNVFDGTAAGACYCCPEIVYQAIRLTGFVVLFLANYELNADSVLKDGYLGTGSSAQVSTRNVHNIAIDPLDENYFASGGSSGDPSVSIWDKRWINQSSTGVSVNQPVFHFTNPLNQTSRDTVWSLRYSGQQRGRLGICSSAGELKIIDIVEGQTSLLQTSAYLPSNPFGGSPWTHNRYIAQTRDLERRATETAKVSLGKDRMPRVIAFDWANDDNAGVGQGLITIRENRELEMRQVTSTNSSAEITARSDLSVGLNQLSLMEAKPYLHAARPTAPYERSNSVGAAEDFGPYTLTGDNLDLDEEREAQRYSRSSPHLGRIIAQSTKHRDRCLRGYMWNEQRNIDIVAGDWQLERLWEIINRLKHQAADGNMVYKSLDLSFIGIAGVWSGEVGNYAKRTITPFPTKMEHAVPGINAAQSRPEYSGERTDYAEHRQLCLAICGWKFTTDALEVECQELIDRGLHYQAIVQAMLHDYRHIALNLLRTLIRSRTIPNIGLNALIASDTINEEQREMCLWMAADTEDPALKALLTYLSSGNWRDVMKTNYLHLGYRVALGLKYLNDTELSGFIQTETARAIKNGDLEGILLTGLGEQAMDLFQTYLTKTNDLQTCVLATAYTNPIYVDDVRWDMWKETYVMQMQSWRAFNESARFTVLHNRMARTRDGLSTQKPLPPTVVLRCNHCQARLGRRPADLPTGEPAESERRAMRVAGPAAHAGTVCPSCGRHLPRCAICMMWLGVPDPSHSSGGSSSISSSSSGGGGANARDSPGSKKAEATMAKFIAFCVACGHGFHADHAKTWFAKHGVCPVPDCRCMCGILA
nr:seh-associated protein 4 [Quercus suber]